MPAQRQSLPALSNYLMMPFIQPFESGNPHFHIFQILNGDALKERFPKDIPGQRIVAREALADGPIQGDTPEVFFANRFSFMNKNYGVSKEEYEAKTLAEYQKIQQIPSDAFVFLWFEDDVFCQLNCWFVAALLWYGNHRGPCYLVRPRKHSHLGFGGLNEIELLDLYQKSTLLLNLAKLSSLWNRVQAGHALSVLRYAESMSRDYPFIAPAVEAYFAAKPNIDDPGRPVKVLRQIIADLGTDSFSEVFLEFCKREPIYGYGDLQVRNLMSKIE